MQRKDSFILMLSFCVGIFKPASLYFKVFKLCVNMRQRKKHQRQSQPEYFYSTAYKGFKARFAEISCLFE